MANSVLEWRSGGTTSSAAPPNSKSMALTAADEDEHVLRTFRAAQRAIAEDGRLSGKKALAFALQATSIAATETVGTKITPAYVLMLVRSNSRIQIAA